MTTTKGLRRRRQPTPAKMRRSWQVEDDNDDNDDEQAQSVSVSASAFVFATIVLISSWVCKKISSGSSCRGKTPMSDLANTMSVGPSPLVRGSAR